MHLGVEGAEQDRDRQDRQPDHGVTTGAPAEQRVHQQDHEDGGVQALASRRRGRARRPARPRRGRRRRRRTGAGASAATAASAASASDDRHGQRPPHQVVPERSFEHRHGHQRGDERPVPPDPPWRIGKRGARPTTNEPRPGARPHPKEVRRPADRPKVRDGRPSDRSVANGRSPDVATAHRDDGLMRPSTASTSPRHPDHRQGGEPTAANVTLLGRVAGWCFDHRIKAVGLWLVAFVAIFGAAGAVGSQFSGNAQVPGSGSAAGFAVLELSTSPSSAPAGSPARSCSGPRQGVDDPEVRAAMEGLFATVDAGFPDDGGVPQHPGAHRRLALRRARPEPDRPGLGRSPAESPTPR